MDARQRLDWENASTLLFAALTVGRISRTARGVFGRVFARAAEERAKGGDGFGTHELSGPLYDDDVAEATRKAWTAVRCGAGVAFRDPELIPRDDRHAVLRRARALTADGRLPDWAAANPPTPVSHRGPLDLVAAMPVRSGGKTWLADVPLAVHPLDPDDVPVACRLLAPDGSRFAVRRHGRGFLRPVFAPGSWTPCGAASFARAARGDVPWCDDPFAARTHARHEVRVPHAAHLPRKAPRGVDPSGPASVGQADWTRDVGPLVLVDGIVHRPCPEPRLLLCRSLEDDGGLVHRVDHVTWLLGDLCGRDEMRTFLTWRPDVDGLLDAGPDGRRSFAVTTSVAHEYAARAALGSWRGDGDGTAGGYAAAVAAGAPDVGDVGVGRWRLVTDLDPATFALDPMPLARLAADVVAEWRGKGVPGLGLGASEGDWTALAEAQSLARATRDPAAALRVAELAEGLASRRLPVMSWGKEEFLRVIAGLVAAEARVHAEAVLAPDEFATLTL